MAKDPNFSARMRDARNAKESKGAATATRAPIAAGVGESKVFGGAYPRQRTEGEIDLANCTLNGLPIPADVAAVITYSMTDQARREREAELDRTRPGWREEPKVALGNGPEEKMIDRYRDGLVEGVEPWEAGIDPMAEIKKKYGKPGERYRFLNPAKIDRDGWRGWEPVKILENGVEKQVTLGRSIFCRMSEARARKRDRYFKGKAQEQMVSAENQRREILEQARRDGVLRVSDANLDSIMRQNDPERGRGGRDQGMTTYRGDEAEAADAMNDADFEPAGRDA